MGRRPVLLASGLHEDQAKFGGGFEDELAVALGAAGIVEGDELVGDDPTAAGEVDYASTESIGRGCASNPGAGLTQELADCLAEFGSVLRDDADGGAIDNQVVLAMRRSAWWRVMAR
jgi:hypothetical protein